MEHTPGPWTIQAIDQPKHRRGFEYIIRDSRNCALAEVGHTDAITDGAEGEANARLIAAAPDLLAALERIEIWLTNQPLDQLSKHEMLNETRIAIAKCSP